MPDPSVSPADMIRNVFDQVSSFTEGLPEAIAALDVLLAVGERDKAEIGRLHERLATTNRNWRVDWDQLVRERERDRQHIARLTERLEDVKGNAYLWMIGELDAEAALQAIVAPDAVLAEKEDANG